MDKRALGLVAVLLLAGCLGTTDEGPSATNPNGSGPSAQRLENASWTAHDDAPSSRTEVVAAHLDPGGSEFLVIGDFYMQAQESRIVEVYDARNDSWSDAPDYPIPI